MKQATWFYLGSVRDTAKSGMGRADNRHLNCLGEVISVNVGGFDQAAKVSSPPMLERRVGGVLGVGAWESHVQGEGRQGVDTSPVPR